MPYGIYHNYEHVTSTKSFIVLPSGDLECRPGFGERVSLVLARGAWDQVIWEEE